MTIPAAFAAYSAASVSLPHSVAIIVAADIEAWFMEFQRKLEFRNTTDPYAIMISEFMLQQTTVAAVEPYYERFLRRFPSLGALASATEDEVMQLWAGLGYYRRSRQLHASAKVLVDSLDSTFPRTVQQLQKLPGFGRYTAGAVLSQAFDLPAPIVEANTTRVFARLAGTAGMPGDTAFMKSLWATAETLVTVAPSPRVFNQGAMELGSQICRPVPLCDSCPVSDHCVAYRLGIAVTIPVVRPRRQSINVDVLCAVLKNTSGRYGVRRIPKGEWHAGMWEFPVMRLLEDTVPEIAAMRLETTLSSAAISKGSHFATLRYQVTHHKITCHVFEYSLPDSPTQLTLMEMEVKFLDLKEISNLPMGSAQKKLLLLLNELNISENL